MKMNYLLDKKTVFSNQRRATSGGPWWYLILVVVFILGGGVVVNSFGKLSGTGSQVAGTASSFLAWPTKNFKPWSSRSKIVTENEDLRQNISELSQKLLSAQARIEELESIEEDLGRPRSDRGVALPAKIILRTGYFSFDNFFLDRGKGASSSVATGQLVTTGSDVVLGEVVAVYDQVSKAKLYSAPGRKTAVRIGAKNIPTLAEGLGGGNYVVTLPAATEVVYNDIVRTEKNGREYILGLVGAVEKNAETPFQKVYIKPPVNIYSLRYVTIIIG